MEGFQGAGWDTVEQANTAKAGRNLIQSRITSGLRCKVVQFYSAPRDPQLNMQVMGAVCFS